MAIGILAAIKKHSFGKVHHILFLIVAVSNVIILLCFPSIFLLVTCCILAVMPFTRPRRNLTIHATAGTLSYIMLIVWYILR